MADRIWVEIGDVEDLDAGLLQDVAVEWCRGIGQVGQLPIYGWVVQATFLIGV